MNIPNSLKFTGKDSSIKGLEKIKLLATLNANAKKIDSNYSSKEGFNGQIPNILIGDYGYPNVNAGFISTQNYKDNDAPNKWKKDQQTFSLSKIIELRQDLLNSKTNLNVKDFNARFTDKLKEIGLASNPVDAEINYDKKISFGNSFNTDILPHGPSAALKKLQITQNPKVPFIVDKYESDIDFKASNALLELSKKGIDEHYLTKILSTGNIGVKIQRKIVPTKWSITTVDDTLGKNIITKISDFEEHPYSTLFGSYMGNYYLAIIFPGPWSYELFETYVGAGLENSENFSSAIDYEGPFGRKTYASNTIGGYYAARLALLEYFLKNKKKGKVLLLRFITDEYWAPLGVWVVREATRNCFSSNKIDFESKDLMLKYSALFLKKKFNLSINVILKQSTLLDEITKQKNLSDF
ncbi:MAG: hypothetical protein WC758_00855 [Candidatus Woesearchaeota archaeon]|jgi:hypothetical protein